jgi:deoxyhypusine synthase
VADKIRDTNKYHHGHDDGLEPVESIDLGRVGTFSDLLRSYQSASFGARRLGDAYSVLVDMAKDEHCFVVMTLSGAMTVAKMGLVICEMIERGYVDMIVSTGALQAHGMIEGSGMKHYKYRPGMSDEMLYERGYDRVYDTLELERNLDGLELIVRPVLDAIPDGAVVGSWDIMKMLGKHLAELFPGQRGILKAAYEHDVPVIIPAFTDSELGLDVACNNQIRREEGRSGFVFDPFIDVYFYRDLAVEQERLGIFTIGGGVPRNWAQQLGPFLEISQLRRGITEGTTQRFRYGVRICPDSEHVGHLSGCTYSEGMSWGKFAPEKEGGRYAEVLCDATMVWPLLIRALIETVPRKAGR